MRYLVMLSFVVALLLTPCPAKGDCTGGVCKFQAGQPVRNIVKAPLVVARAVVAVPVKAVKATAHVFREVRPVRRTVRFCGRVLTLRGPLASRVRAHRCR